MPPETFFDPPNTGIPWVDTALLVLVVVLVTFCILIAFFYKVAWKPLKEILASVKRDTAVVRDQTENSHANAPNPNLRHDLDFKHEELLSEFRSLKTSHDDLRDDLTGIRQELRNDREEQRRTSEKLEAHIRETNTVRLAQVEAELDAHRDATEPDPH